jgi:hypothetical protein
MLPMVALTLMVEHFHYDVETKGLQDALQRLGSTLLVALASFGVFAALLADGLAVRYPGIAFGVAAALTLAVTEPAGSGLAGQSFLLVHPPGRAARLRADPGAARGAR